MFSMYGLHLKSETANKRWQKNTTTLSINIQVKVTKYKNKEPQINKKEKQSKWDVLIEQQKARKRKKAWISRMKKK